ncbi:MAG: hypothetical protein HYU66_25590, partial [Armatimonadetes bacterium]|nr:hypothetical protein [Armatimonadota bacterium]
MRKSTICLAALALLLGAGYAADEEAAAKPPRWLSLTIDPAWQLLMPEGNRARAGHYLVPFSAPYFGIESLDVRARGGFDWVDLSLARIPGRPFDTRAGLWLPGLPGYVKGRWDKSVFFEEPLFPAPLQSGRSNQGYDVLLMPLPGLQFTG